MIVGIDLDGVCYDFVGAFRQYSHERHGLPFSAMPEAVSWDFPVNDWGWSTETFLRRFEEGVDERFLFLHGRPFDGVKEGIDLLRDAGHHVHFVTHRENVGRPAVAVESTVQWLAFHDIAFDSITFTKDKPVVQADVFIEDNVKNFQALWAADIPSWLMSQPYNEQVVWPNLQSPWRVRSMPEFARKVIEYDDAWFTGPTERVAA